MKKTSVLSITLMLGLMILSGGISAQAATPPARVTIDQLSNYFVPVDFDHVGHVDMIGGCSECHHHTTGAVPKNEECQRCHSGGKPVAAIACRDCHAADPFSAAYVREQGADRFRYHLDQPGLKGAYHLNCVGCHRNAGGPVDCVDCHARTDAGDKLYRTGSYTPKPGPADAEH